jgi:hypothetical protein
MVFNNGRPSIQSEFAGSFSTGSKCEINRSNQTWVQVSSRSFISSPLWTPPNFTVRRHKLNKDSLSRRWCHRMRWGCAWRKPWRSPGRRLPSMRITQTRNPKPEIRNQRHETRPETRNPEPEAQDPKYETRKPKAETRILKPEPRPETRNPRLKTRDPRPATRSPRPEI